MTAHPIEDGTLVRLARELTDDERGWVTLPHGGERLVVDAFWSAGNPDDDEIPVDFYEGHDEHGCTVVVPADALEVVKSSAQMAARRPPTPRQILDGLDLLGNFDEFETDQSEPDGKGRTVYGKTADGLPFGFTLHVTAIWETDL